MIDKDNSYLKDARHWLRRAAKAIATMVEDWSDEALHDSVIFFAFGVEKLFKAIVSDVNPLFIMESAGFDNACAALYRDRLLRAPREKADKEANKNQVNRNVLPYNASMLRAKEFSATVSSHMGVLTDLAEFRGILAHRTLAEMDHEHTKRFIIRSFYPLVAEFAKDFGFEAIDWLGSYIPILKRASEQEQAHYDFARQMTALVEKHLTIFRNRQSDAAFMEATLQATESELDAARKGDRLTVRAECPACASTCLLRVLIDMPKTAGMDESGYITGTECKFCDLVLTEGDELDYFAMQQYWT